MSRELLLDSIVSELKNSFPTVRSVCNCFYTNLIEYLIE